MKALWFSPGKLTIAYWNKQRMRYIAPVSLYIFISATYFLCALLLHSKTDIIKINSGQTAKKHNQISVLPKGGVAAADTSDAKFNLFMERKIRELSEKHGDLNEFVREKISHDLPKVFFFMIPIMAMILKLLFIRRKEAFFVDHAIFALHYHSFWFSVFLLNLFHFPDAIETIVFTVLIGAAALYMVAAMHKVYKTPWIRSITNTIALGACYSIMFGLTKPFHLLNCNVSAMFATSIGFTQWTKAL
jgi:hypothetical protein